MNNMNIKGRILKISYYKKETGYSVLVISLDHDDYLKLHEEYHFISNRLTCVGITDRQPYVDEEYIFEGQFVKDLNYGLQFKYSSFKRPMMNSASTIIDYLSSDLFEGIGIASAKAIVDTLGEKAIEIIAKDENALNIVPKLSKKQQKTVYDTIVSNLKNQEAFMFFIQNGLSLDLAKRIIDKVGSDALSEIKENPYPLIDKIDYFGFIKCDRFALSIGIDKHAYCRLSYLVKYILLDVIYKSGNSFTTFQELYEGMRKYLGDTDLNKEEYLDLLNRLVKENIIYLDKEFVFDYHLYQKEIELARIIAKDTTHDIKFDEKKINKAFLDATNAINITLNTEQELAVKKAFTNKISIITGGPGTGKSTIVKVILDMFIRLNKNKENALLGFKLLAPTGKASKRLNEITNFEAMTIHKYLGYNGIHFEHDAYNQTDDLFIIIDEASMMDLPLAYQLFASLNKDAQIVIVGDVCQLPSVGPGQILKDLIDTKEITTTYLTKIHRQGANSKIISLAHSINEGLLPDDLLDEYPDRIFYQTSSDNITETIKEIIKKMLDDKIDIINDVEVLAPMYRTVGGINELNKAIQSLYNKEIEVLNYQSQQFKIGDKVIQLVNRIDKKIMNGDVGIIDSFTYKFDKINGLIVKYDIGKVEYKFDELDDLSLAYAISVHKSQGSEFNTIILPISQAYSFMLKRKLIYTAVTRAKAKLILVGEVFYLNRGISFIEKPRLTILKNQIIQFINHPKAKLTIEDVINNQSIEKKKDDLSPYDFESVIGEEEYDI